MNFRRLLWLFILVLGCPSPPPVMTDMTPQATISGTVSVFRPASNERYSNYDAQLKARVLSALNSSKASNFDVLKSPLDAARPFPVRPGDITRRGTSKIQLGEAIVRFREKITSERALKLFTLSHYACAHLGYASQHLHLVKCSKSDQTPLSESETRALVKSLSSERSVLFAEVNSIRNIVAVPDDKLFSSMWHLPALNLPAAWDIESGANHPATIAVIDTGSLQHPDLAARLLPGYDMIGDSTRAGDGDGRDADPTDVGHDGPQGRSSYHGLHTAGTVGATTNNMSGIAGVHWGARIVPVRALGSGGGTDFDIAASIQWAAGGTIPDIPRNANRAAVINLSVGGEGDPSQTYQEVIDAAVAQGVVIVVAAGNENISANRFTPCNQERVICVGATRFDGTRSSYSNYGARIDVMAPGGELSQDANGDGEPDGVLSLGKDDATDKYSYKFAEGTSMAAPHVAGVVALLKSKVPAATFEQVKAALINSANIKSKCAEGCGAGLVNALGALQIIGGQAPQGPPKMTVSSAEFLFTPEHPSTKLQITNSGGSTLNVDASFSGIAKARMTADLLSFSVAPGTSESITVQADLAGIADALTLSAALGLKSNGGDASVNLRLRSTTPATMPAVVALVYKDTAGEWQVKTQTVAKAPKYEWKITVAPGSYYVFGAQDSNGNTMFDDSEPVGMYPNIESPKEIKLANGDKQEGLSFTLAPVENISDDESVLIGKACQDDLMCSPGFCATGFTDGYCTQDCLTSSCPTGARCVTVGPQAFCLRACAGPLSGRSSCRTSYVCEDDGTGLGVCIPGCQSDADCEPSTCDVDTGYCR